MINTHNICPSSKKIHHDFYKNFPEHLAKDIRFLLEGTQLVRPQCLTVDLTYCNHKRS